MAMLAGNHRSGLHTGTQRSGVCHRYWWKKRWHPLTGWRHCMQSGNTPHRSGQNELPAALVAVMQHLQQDAYQPFQQTPPGWAMLRSSTRRKHYRSLCYRQKSTPEIASTTPGTAAGR